MRRLRTLCWLNIAAWLLATVAGAERSNADNEPTTVRSKQSGEWSDPDTWDAGRAPEAGEYVLIRTADRVLYDVESDDVIRLLQIAGTLEFARDKNTLLNVALVKVATTEELCEEGFDCHAPMAEPIVGASQPALLVGTADRPVDEDCRATIRLHYLEGMDEKSCPAIVCCGGRMEFHGTPMPRTWLKLQQTVQPGQVTLMVKERPVGWRRGDRIVITRTSYAQGQVEERTPEEYEENEIRILEGTGQKRWPSNDIATNLEERLAVPAGAREPNSHGYSIHFDEPLKHRHVVEGECAGEVANLSRNVVVESADPDGHRGHTMYHRGSKGAISYAEFRHLGKRGVLGRYPIHFHLVEDTMRGSYVKGASIWDSENRWIAIHQTSYLVVQDCVGFDCVGHGYFLENGYETLNNLDRNMAIAARSGKPLPDQAMPFDLNRGAGFWWANSLNSFSNNVAVDCAEYGYRLEVKRADGFDPELEILQTDGKRTKRDIRTAPFIKFDNNECHSQPHFGLNLRGIARPTSREMMYDKQNRVLVREAREASMDQRYPFWVRNYRAWNCTWGIHMGSNGVFLDNIDIGECQYGIWRSVLDRNVWRDVSLHDNFKDLHMTFSIGLPEPEDDTEENGAYLAAIQGFVDDFAPVTVITNVEKRDDELVVRGATADCSAIQSVRVNNREAISTRGSFDEWEVHLPLSEAKEGELTAYAVDIIGNVESTPHRVELN